MQHDSIILLINLCQRDIDMTDKEALVYEQNCQEFRSLNGFFGKCH